MRSIVSRNLDCPVLYCPSYQGVLLAIYLRALDNQITIVTSNPSVFRYLEDNNFDVIKFSPHNLRLTSIRSLFSARKFVKTLFSRINPSSNSQLIFYHNACDVFGFLFVFLWSCVYSGKIFYLPLDPPRETFGFLQLYYRPKILFRLILFRILLPLPGLRMVRTYSSIAFGIGTCFLNTVNSSPFPFGSPNDIRNKVASIYSQDNHTKIIFLGITDVSLDQSIMLSSIIDKLNSLDINTYYKPHPVEVPSYSTVYCSLSRLNANSPAELYISSSSIVLGDSSASMIYAVDQVNAEVISLARLLHEPSSPKLLASLQFLSTALNFSNIYFPRTLNELSTYIDKF